MEQGLGASSFDADDHVWHDSVLSPEFGSEGGVVLDRVVEDIKVSILIEPRNA